MTTRAERLGLEPGSAVTYENGHVSLPAIIVGEVEGWFEIRFSDGSTAIARPSRLHTKPLP